MSTAAIRDFNIPGNATRFICGKVNKISLRIRKEMNESIRTEILKRILNGTVWAETKDIDCTIFLKYKNEISRQIHPPKKISARNILRDFNITPQTSPDLKRILDEHCFPVFKLLFQPATENEAAEQLRPFKRMKFVGNCSQ